MVEWHMKSKRKASGGKRNSVERCTKKKAWKGGEQASTKTQENSTEDRKVLRGRGKNNKVLLTSTKFANFYDANAKKTVKAEIIGVKENDANRLYARSNITTKGAIIKLKVSGKEIEAKVTNRPGQDGVVNAKIA